MALNIQYCSDLHLEFPENRKFISANSLPPQGDILVIAGDLVTFCDLHLAKDFIDYASDHFPAVYWVPGNHEYYGYDIADKKSAFTEKIRENFFLINNKSTIHAGVKLMFSTLWSHISPERADELERCISDFSQIRYHGRQLSTQNFSHLHDEAVAFLSKDPLPPKPEPTVVVTHHVPTLQHYPRRYRNSPLSEAFVTELSKIITGLAPAAWIYGHHHENTPAFNIGTTKMLTNQLGYVHHYEHKSFQKAAIIEI